MISTLAIRALLGRRGRTLLAIAGVAVSAAMLLDMVMLATGLRESFRDLLESRGYQIRVAPRGTLPFDTDATIRDVSSVIDSIIHEPRVTRVSPVLGAQVHVQSARGAGVSAFALGVDARVQADYQLERGRDAVRDDEIVANTAFVAASGATMDDTLLVQTGYDPQTHAALGSAKLRLVGVARFLYLAVGDVAMAMPLTTLQRLGGEERRDRASLLMVEVGSQKDVEPVRAWIDRAIPRVNAISTDSAVVEVDRRLTYFRQLAAILGTVSLGVGIMLVTTLLTVSVNERLGELAAMRAIGISKLTIIRQIVLEGIAINAIGAVAGLALGLVTARWLNSILASFPGLPAAIDFFLFQPRAAVIALGLLAVAGVVAGAYPAWRGASQPIAATLREEAVA